MERVIENFSDIDLDLLLEEPENRAGPSHADAEVAPIAHFIKAAPVIPKFAGAASEPAHESEV